MSFPRRIRRVYEYLVHRDRMERDLDDELQAYLEEATEANRRLGMSSAEAVRQARMMLGGMAQTKERDRAARPGFQLASVIADTRYALRSLRRSPGFALTSIAILMIGIGVNAAVFTVARAALFQGFPSVTRNERVLYIETQGSRCCVSYPDFEDLRAQARSFEGMAVVHGIQVTLSDGWGFPETLNVTEVSADTFRVAGPAPVLGRDFSESDERPGAPRAAILADGFWERRYARDPSVIGSTIRIDEEPATVIGVMGPGVSFPQKQDMWLSLVPDPRIHTRQARDLWFIFGRLADGVSVEDARAEVAAIGQSLARAYPETNRDLLPAALTFNEFFVGPNENRVYFAMWGAVSFVLLIACANLANLTLARTTGRRREISIRLAVGAGRRRVIRQLLTESLLLSAAGALPGWWLAAWIVGLYQAANRGPGLLPWRVLDYSMDSTVLGYLALTIGVTGVLSGLAPAIRLSHVDVGHGLRELGRGVTGGRWGKRIAATLVTAEVALTLVLLAGAGVMIRSYLNVSTGDPGVRTDHVLVASLPLPVERYPDSTARNAFFDRLGERLRSLPGIEAVAIADRLPAEGASRRVPYETEGSPAAEAAGRPSVSVLSISADYFRALGRDMVLGRAFREFDDEAGLQVAIVNELFGEQHWPGQEVLGQRVRLVEGTTPEDWLTVVGVAPNIVQSDATRQRFDPIVYVPRRQTASDSHWVIVRTSVPPERLRDAFRVQVQALDSALAVALGPFTLEERLAEGYWDRQLYGVLFLTLGAIALLLASAGLYAVLAHSVSQSTQEIGVRLALGGTPVDVFSWIVREGLFPLGAGLVLGLAGALAVTRVLSAQLVGVSAVDPPTLLAAAGVLIASGLPGCMLPAIRAMRVDPAVALRHD